jgi:ANTAR domain/GAF domain
MPVDEGDGPSAWPEEASRLEEQMRRADLWEAGADERERLADERERLADEREVLADERERLADRQDRTLDHREADRRAEHSSTGDVDMPTEAEAAEAALRRAEAGVRRADAELIRARQAAARVGARAARRLAGSERSAATQHAEETVDAEESAWSADRRDFVAAEREDLAAERDEIADQRDETAELRERLADDRERIALERERRLEAAQRVGQPTTAAWLSASQEHSLHAALRAEGERRREQAAASRRAAAEVRTRTAAEWGPQAYGPTLVASFARLARGLFDSDEVGVLPQVLKFTVGAVAGCDWASITLRRNGHVVDSVTSDAVAAELDDLQFGTGLGPTTEALQRENPIYVPRLADSQRWPVLADTAAQLGVASCLCHGLFLHQPAQWSPLGTFSLYSATPDAFSEEDQEFGSILAAYVAVAVAMADRRDEVDRREAALHRGLSTRDVIGQAKGILMERQHLAAGDAFDVLRRASQRLNRKVADVAEHLAETGELPT